MLELVQAGDLCPCPRACVGRTYRQAPDRNRGVGGRQRVGDAQGGPLAALFDALRQRPGRRVASDAAQRSNERGDLAMSRILCGRPGRGQGRDQRIRRLWSAQQPKQLGCPPADPGVLVGEQPGQDLVRSRAGREEAPNAGGRRDAGRQVDHGDVRQLERAENWGLLAPFRRFEQGILAGGAEQEDRDQSGEDASQQGRSCVA